MSSVSLTDKVLRGIALIRKYDPDASFSAEHDVIYFGGHETSYDRMSPKERAQMKEWHWFNEYDAWAHYV